MRAYEFGTVTGNGTYPNMNETYRFRVVLDGDGSGGYVVRLFRGFKSDSACGWSHGKARTLPLLPPRAWGYAYRYRKFGALKVHRAVSALIRKVVAA